MSEHKFTNVPLRFLPGDTVWVVSNEAQFEPCSYCLRGYIESRATTMYGRLPKLACPNCHGTGHAAERNGYAWQVTGPWYVQQIRLTGRAEELRPVYECVLAQVGDDGEHERRTFDHDAHVFGSRWDANPDDSAEDLAAQMNARYAKLLAAQNAAEAGGA